MRTGSGGNSHARTGMLRPAYNTTFHACRRSDAPFTRNAVNRRPATAAKTSVRAATIRSCANHIPESGLIIEGVIVTPEGSCGKVFAQPLLHFLRSEEHTSELQSRFGISYA